METGPTWTQPDKNPTHPEAAVSGPDPSVDTSVDPSVDPPVVSSVLRFLFAKNGENWSEMNGKQTQTYGDT